MKQIEMKFAIKLGIMICAFLYALSEMCAENIHWAIGDLILIALWMGIKSNLYIMKKLLREKGREKVKCCN